MGRSVLQGQHSIVSDTSSMGGRGDLILHVTLLFLVIERNVLIELLIELLKAIMLLCVKEILRKMGVMKIPDLVIGKIDKSVKPSYK